MKLLIVCLLLLALIVTFGVFCRVRLLGFCEDAKTELDNAKAALQSWDYSGADRFLDRAGALCDKNKNLLFVYLNHVHYEDLIKTISAARAYLGARDGASALGEIARACSQINDLQEFDKIAVGNIL
jgi:hypothetical protein